MRESGETYRYGIPTGDAATGPSHRFTPEPVRIGEHVYIHNTWFFSAAGVPPERLVGHTAQLLEDFQGYTMPEEVRMSRFVRVVDRAALHELIVFYLEPLAPTGLRALDFVEGGAGAAVFDSLSAETTARSRAAFRVVDD